MESVHVPVLLHETVECLTKPRQHEGGAYVHHPTEWYLDGTLGGGGHARAIAKAMKGKLNVVGLDLDPRAVRRADELLRGEAKRLIVERESFRNLDKVLDQHGIQAVDMILLDLGLSSDELEASGKGFSFLKDEPLVMTFGTPTDYAFTAKSIVNGWKEGDIANVIFAYGEERFGRKIARAIVAYREKKSIETSAELAEIVKSAVPPFYRRGKVHPATKTFQALRIAVNDELKALEEAVAKGYARLAPKGRMAIISFHSLEDRIVKTAFRAYANEGDVLITKRPIRPTDQEAAENPRSRSAKLRIIKKNAD